MASTYYEIGVPPWCCGSGRLPVVAACGLVVRDGAKAMCIATQAALGQTTTWAGEPSGRAMTSQDEIAESRRGDVTEYRHNREEWENKEERHD
jgi:hypothetical protein